MPERFEIYIVYKRCYINTLPFLSFPFLDARLRRYGTHAKRPARSHQAHLLYVRRRYDVNAFKIEHGSILSASSRLRPSTDVDAFGVNAQAF